MRGLLLLLCFPVTLLANDLATRPGELILERPTLISLGFEWRITGDSNHDATAKVEYREVGLSEWQPYLPLFRIGKGVTTQPIASPGFPYTIPDALAGSIMDLKPGMTYEVRLTLEDPDGIEGEAVQIITQTTRSEPVVVEGGEVRHVYPPGHEGPKGNAAAVPRGLP